MPSSWDEMVNDIEDIITSNDITPKERYKNKNSVVYRVRKKGFNKNNYKLNGNNITEDDDILLTYDQDSIIPGTQTIYIKTWGCAHNSSDSEYMAGQLASYGYRLTDIKEEAHLWLLNSCTVKNPAEDHFRNEIESAKKLNKYIVVAGCVPQGAPKVEFLHGLSIVGVQQIDRVLEVVEETLKGNTVRLLGQKKQNGKKIGGAKLELPKVRRNPLIEIIPINTGCLNQCTYCKTKHARGDLGSYPPEDIVSRAEQAFSEGVVELWLTSEDTGAYGRDIGTNLPALLRSLITVIPEGCMMRVGMTNPPYILEHLEEMAEILSHPRVYSFLHVPVQSGSDNVLMDMKREYTCADFEKVVETLRALVPGLTIATDIICGFPTETDEDFSDTLKLCAKYKFPSLFINQFFPRPGTPAARMQRIPPQQVKQRTKELSLFFQSYQPYNHKIDEIQSILVTEISHDKKHLVGHNKYYEQVLVSLDKQLLGKMVQVRISSASKYSMHGELLLGSERNVNPNQAFKQGAISTGYNKRQEIKENIFSPIPIAILCILLVFFIKFICLIFKFI